MLAQGVTAFWAASPNTEAGDVHMHWPTEDSSTLIFRKDESRCILIASGLGPRAHMYAHIKPCDSKQASGLLTVAAAAAPPPPPGAQTRHFYDPVRAPPPPPSVKRAALEVYVRKEIRPRVVAICEGGLEGEPHREICMAVAESLGKYQPIAGYGLIAPFCERVCWHSCDGESHANGQARSKPQEPPHLLPPSPEHPLSLLQDDGFTECPSETCAQDSCLDFLLRQETHCLNHTYTNYTLCMRCLTLPPFACRECPPVLHDAIQNIYDKVKTHSQTRTHAHAHTHMHSSSSSSPVNRNRTRRAAARRSSQFPDQIRLHTRPAPFAHIPSPQVTSFFPQTCALTPPSPPRPPAMPPPPTGKFVPAAPSPPPPPPPPAPYFQQRSRDEEKDYDPDCELVSYATCKGIVADYAAEHGTANVLRVSFSPCEGTSLDEGCFRVRSHSSSHLTPHTRVFLP